MTGETAVDAPESYPAPRIPLFPVPSWGTFTAPDRRAVPSVLDAKFMLPVTYGRMAIGLAVRDLGITPGDEVLIPAYHCLSMVDPVRWAGATPVFYRVREDTSVDLEDVRSRITPRTRALMVTHYFGFPQTMGAIRALCDERGLALLEDCAHSFLGEHEGRPLGSHGDYTIASPMKFFAIYEGGLLTSDRRSLERIRLIPIGWKFGLRAAVVMLERSVEYRRFGIAGFLLRGPLRLKSALLRLAKSLRPAGAESWWGPAVGGQSSGRTGDFEPRWVDRKMSFPSRWILSHTSRARLAEARRRNYQVLLERLSGLPGARPLFATLPDGVIPFAFPLLVDDPVPVFAALKRQGVPIMRFGEFLADEVVPRDYPETARLSTGLFQFPCHQELRADELSWMAETVRAALLAASDRGRP